MDFETFEKGDIGFHFGNETQAKKRGDVLKQSGRIITAYLDIENPIYISSDIMSWRPRNLAIKLLSDNIISAEEYRAILAMDTELKYSYDSPAAVELRRMLSEKGYDGIVYQNMFEGDGESYIAFYPEQVIIIDDGKGGNNGGTVSSENSPLPEVSAENAETDMAQSLINDALGIENLSEGQKTLRKIGKAFGVEIGFKNLDEWRTDDNGKRYLFSPDGEYDPKTGKITLNTSKRVKHSPVAYILKHELTHSLEKNGVLYNDFADAVMESTAFKNYIKEKGFNTAAEYNADIVRRYTEKGIKNFDEGKADLEMVANFVGDMLFGGRTEITSTLIEGMEPKPKRSFIQWIKDALAYLRQKLTGQKVYVDEITRLEEMFLETAQKAQAKENTAQQDGEQKSYSISKDDVFARYCDSIDEIQRNDDISRKGQYIEVAQQTPTIIVEKANAQNLPMAIQFDIAYLETRHEGKLNGNYHNLGAENMKELPKMLETPEYIIKLSNGRLNIIVDMSTSKGKQALVSIELSQSKQVNSKFNKYNIILTAFGAKSGYLEKIVNNPDNQVLYNKKTEPQGTDRLHKGSDGINGSVSNITVPQKAQSVNNNSMQETKKYSLPQTTDADSLLEQYENGEITRDEYLEQLKGERTLNPVEIGRMTKEDASTTPPLEKKEGSNEGDRESKTNIDEYTERIEAYGNIS